MTLDGALFPSGAQDWSVDVSEPRYASDTLPAAGTTALAAQAKLTAKLRPDAPIQITLDSPALTAETPLVRISGMAIALSGTPENYTVDHKSGFVEIIGSEFAATAKTAGFARFPADGSVAFANEEFTGQAALRVSKAKNAPMSVDYTFAKGAGTAAIEIPSIQFEPQGLQPQALLPALRGKIARVTGEARAQFDVAFADGALTQSGGSLDLINMSVGTAPGPIDGLNTTLRFTSLLPLETDGAQTLTMDSFNPGLALEDGEVTYRFVPNGVQVDAARWPVGNGAFSLDPFTWVYAAEENRVVMRVEDVALGDFLEDVGNKKLEATGTVVGVFPIVVRGIEVLVEDGRISVPEGGVIRYEQDRIATIPNEGDLVNQLRAGVPIRKSRSCARPCASLITAASARISTARWMAKLR